MIQIQLFFFIFLYLDFNWDFNNVNSLKHLVTARVIRHAYNEGRGGGKGGIHNYNDCL